MTTTPSAASTTIKDPIDPSKNYTNEDHEDYAVNKGTAVYAMCDGVFTAKYCVGSMTSPTGTDAYVSLGICGNLVPAAQWETADHRKPQKIQYGHLDIASYFANDALFVCLGGVNAHKGLRETLLSLGVTEVMEAMDMDQFTNPQVRQAIGTLRREVQSIPGIRYYQCTWNPRFKGVDDYLLDWTKRRTA